MKRLSSFSVVASLVAIAMAKPALPDVNGRILDEQGTPMPFVNVVLLNQADSSFVEGVTSDQMGYFSILAPSDAYLLRVSSVGYDTQYVPISSRKQQTYNVQLHPSQEVLNAVEVAAQLPKTKLTPRGMQTSVQGSVLEKVGSAEDALSRIPGLLKTANGLVVIGKGVPVYYINGRRVHDLQELKRLRSEEIASVEVINNPGAQYDAKVSAVVRIRTIRHQGDGLGFNMGVTDEQSLRKANYNDPFAYLNMNWRKGDVDIFGGGSYHRWHNLQTSTMMQKSFGTPGFLQDGSLRYAMEERVADFNLGANWQISDKHSVGIRIDKSHTGLNRVRQSLIDDFYRDGVLEDHVSSYGHHDPDEDPNSMKVNTYYNGTAGKMGIDFNADYYLLNSSQSAHTDEVSSAVGSSTVNTLTHAKSQLWAAKLVLSYPIWKGQLEAGTEEVISRRTEDYGIDNKQAVSYGLIADTDTEVQEDNYAFFLEYGVALPKIGQVSAGIRYEHVAYSYDSDYEYPGTANRGNQSTEYKQDNFFPSFSWANVFSLPGGNPLQMSLSYSMKTQRPDFYSLNSAIRYHSRYIWQSGNSALQNEVRHDVSYNARWKILTLIGQYSCRKDALSQWSSLYNNDGIVLVKTCNLNDPVHAASYYVNVAPTWGCWNLSCTAGVMQQWFETDATDSRSASGLRRLNFDDHQWVAQMNNTWTLGAKSDGTGAWRLELMGTLQTKGYSMNTRMTNNYFQLNAAIQRSLLKNDALTLRLECTDLAQKADYNVASDCGSHLVCQDNRFDQHRLKFSATYSFNAARSKYKGTGAGKEVQSRMK